MCAFNLRICFFNSGKSSAILIIYYHVLNSLLWNFYVISMLKCESNLFYLIFFHWFRVLGKYPSIPSNSLILFVHLELFLFFLIIVVILFIPRTFSWFFIISTCFCFIIPSYNFLFC